MTEYRSSNEQSIWISALANHIAINTLMIEDGQCSLHILANRIADRYFNVPRGKRSTGVMPVYNPLDKSRWPELLGWLVTVGEMTECEVSRGQPHQQNPQKPSELHALPGLWWRLRNNS